MIKHDSTHDDVLKHMPKALIKQYVDEFRQSINMDKPYRASMSKKLLIQHWGEHIPTNVIMKYKQDYLEAKANKTKAVRKPRVVKPKVEPKIEPKVDINKAATKIQKAFRTYRDNKIKVKEVAATKIQKAFRQHKQDSTQLTLKDFPFRNINLAVLNRDQWKDITSNKLKFFNEEQEFYAGKNFDMTWWKNSQEFIKNLNNDEIYTVCGYTLYGDKLVNGKLRHDTNKYEYDRKAFVRPFLIQIRNIIKSKKTYKGLLDNPTTEDNNLLKQIKSSTDLSHISHIMKQLAPKISESFIHQCVDEYIIDFGKIMKKAPKVTKKMTLFRGIRSDIFANAIHNHTYTNEGYISTSIDMYTAGLFSRNYAVQIITVLPGTRALLIAGISSLRAELEVILPHRSKYYVTNTKHTLNFQASQHEPLIKAKIIDITVVK